MRNWCTVIGCLKTNYRVFSYVNVSFMLLRSRCWYSLCLDLSEMSAESNRCCVCRYHISHWLYIYTPVVKYFASVKYRVFWRVLLTSRSVLLLHCNVLSRCMQSVYGIRFSQVFVRFWDFLFLLIKGNVYLVY